MSLNDPNPGMLSPGTAAWILASTCARVSLSSPAPYSGLSMKHEHPPPIRVHLRADGVVPEGVLHPGLLQQDVSLDGCRHGAAATLLDPSELDAGFRCKGKAPAPMCLVLGRGGKHSAPECQRQRRARTLSRPSPCTVEQPQACSISRSSIAALVAKATPPPRA